MGEQCINTALSTRHGTAARGKDEVRTSIRDIGAR